MYIHIYFYICIYLHMDIYIYMYIFTYVYIYTFVFAYIICIYIHLYLHIYIYLYTYWGNSYQAALPEPIFCKILTCAGLQAWGTLGLGGKLGSLGDPLRGCSLFVFFRKWDIDLT